MERSIIHLLFIVFFLHKFHTPTTHTLFIDWKSQFQVNTPITQTTMKLPTTPLVVLLMLLLLHALPYIFHVDVVVAARGMHDQLDQPPGYDNIHQLRWIIKRKRPPSLRPPAPLANHGHIFFKPSPPPPPPPRCPNSHLKPPHPRSQPPPPPPY